MNVQKYIKQFLAIGLLLAAIFFMTACGASDETNEINFSIKEADSEQMQTEPAQAQTPPEQTQNIQQTPTDSVVQPAQQAQSSSAAQPAQQAQSTPTTAQQTPLEQKQQPETQTNTESAESEKPATIESEAAQISDSNVSYFGIWEITSGAPSGFSALSEADITALIGKRFEYFKEYALYGDAQKLENPIYHEFTISAEEFAESVKGSTLETAGISQAFVQVIEIENAIDFGSSFYIKDENTLIMLWDGAFFELRKIQ